MRFKLIMASVKPDICDKVVDAAKEAGATGATGPAGRCGRRHQRTDRAASGGTPGRGLHDAAHGGRSDPAS